MDVDFNVDDLWIFDELISNANESNNNNDNNIIIEEISDSQISDSQISDSDVVKLQIIEKFNFLPKHLIDSGEILRCEYKYLNYKLIIESLPYEQVNFMMVNDTHYYQKKLEYSNKFVKLYHSDINTKKWELSALNKFVLKQNIINQRIKEDIENIQNIEKVFNMKIITKSFKHMNDYYRDIIVISLYASDLKNAIENCSVKQQLADIINEYDELHESEVLNSELTTTEIDFYSSNQNCFCFIILNCENTNCHKINTTDVNNIKITNVSFIILYINLTTKDIIYICKYKDALDSKNDNYNILCNFANINGELPVLINDSNMTTIEKKFREKIHTLFTIKYLEFIKMCDVLCNINKNECNYLKTYIDKLPFIVNTLNSNNDIVPTNYCLIGKILNINSFDKLINIMIVINTLLTTENKINISISESVHPNEEINEEINCVRIRINVCNLLTVLETTIRVFATIKSIYETINHTNPTDKHILYDMNDLIKCITDKHQQLIYTKKNMLSTSTSQEYVKSYVNMDWIIINGELKSRNLYLKEKLKQKKRKRRRKNL